MSVRNQEPNSLWNHFADLNAVPRPSKKEERVIEFMMDFGKSLNLMLIELIKQYCFKCIKILSKSCIKTCNFYMYPNCEYLLYTSRQ